MKDILLYAAGASAMLVALAHGYLGETRAVRPLEGPASAKRIVRAIMFLSAVYWFAAGLALAVTPLWFDGALRAGIAFSAAAMLASGVIGNFWATRGRHFGWILLSVPAALAVAGA